MTPRKTANEIADLIVSQLEASLNTTIPLFPKAVNRLLAKVFGGVYVLLFQFAGFMLLQLFIKHASNKPISVGGIVIKPLAAWGELVDIFQGAGQAAQLTVSVTVLVQGGTLISGSRVINTDTQVVYLTVGDVALDSSSVSATIQAAEVGVRGNVDAGVELQFVSPPAAVEQVVSVTAAPVLGVDPEDTEVFRRNIMERYAFRPQGGAYADYRDWAQEVTGVQRAYPYSGWELDDHPDDGPTRGCGEVFTFVESAADVDGVPAQLGTGGRPPDPEWGGLLQDVFDHIEADDTGLASRRNINAWIRVYPIHAEPWDWTTGGRTVFDVEVQGLAWVRDEVTVKAAVVAALTEYFYDREPFITGLDIPPRGDIITLTTVGGVAGRIVAAYNGAITSVQVSVSSVNITDGIYYLSEGERCKLGAVTWS